MTLTIPNFPFIVMIGLSGSERASTSTGRESILLPSEFLDYMHHCITVSAYENDCNLG